MTCPFLHSCNELVTQSTYNHFCKTKKRYLKCDIYIGKLDKKRPSAWNHSSEKMEAVDISDKLEAVKTWFIEYSDTKIEKFDHPWRKLEKILEDAG